MENSIKLFRRDANSYVLQGDANSLQIFLSRWMAGNADMHTTFFGKFYGITAQIKNNLTYRVWFVVKMILAFAVICSSAYAENLIEPEIVRLESISINGDQKTVHVGNVKVIKPPNASLPIDQIETPLSPRGWCW